MKSYTDLEQSKALSEILPLESADMTYIGDVLISYPYCENKFKGEDNVYPAWSLAALLEVLPPIEGFKPIIDLDINQIYYEGKYRDELCFNGNNLIDACVEMIIKLKEKVLL